jgi:hypothetical protein
MGLKSLSNVRVSEPAMRADLPQALLYVNASLGSQNTDTRAARSGAVIGIGNRDSDDKHGSRRARWLLHGHASSRSSDYTLHCELTDCIPQLWRIK